eukprot:scaffold49550_cov18-Tisochrysis_lutea.AAC.2
MGKAFKQHGRSDRLDCLHVHLCSTAPVLTHTPSKRERKAHSSRRSSRLEIHTRLEATELKPVVWRKQQA